MAAAARRVLGRAPEVGVWDFATDGVYTMGVVGIPVVDLEPGEERYAHAAGERICLATRLKARVSAQLDVELLAE